MFTICKSIEGAGLILNFLLLVSFCVVTGSGVHLNFFSLSVLLPLFPLLSAFPLFVTHHSLSALSLLGEFSCQLLSRCFFILCCSYFHFFYLTSGHVRRAPDLHLSFHIAPSPLQASLLSFSLVFSIIF